MPITLNDEQINALVKFAHENDRAGGTTAWGPKFNDVMKVAQEVRDMVNAMLTSNEVAHPELADLPRPVSVWQISGDTEISYLTWHRYFANTSILPTQRWRVGRDGDALVGYAKEHGGHIAVLRIGDDMWWDIGDHACLTSVLAKAKRTGITD